MTAPRQSIHDPLKPVLMLFLATTCWGLSFPLMKGLVLSQQQLAPDATVWFVTAQSLVVRFGIAAILMALFCRWRPTLRRRRIPPPASAEPVPSIGEGYGCVDIKLGAGLGFFAGVGTLFQMAALGQTLSSVSAFLTQFTVLSV